MIKATPISLYLNSYIAYYYLKVSRKVLALFKVALYTHSGNESATPGGFDSFRVKNLLAAGEKS